ncbi:MAG: guanine deaminase [Pseudomonadota bacterium]
MTSSNAVAHRGEILHCLDNPSEHPESVQHLADGVLLVEDGHITACKPSDAILDSLPIGTHIQEHRDALIVPGFIDTHIHFPQCDIIASYGTQLLDWLETYTFPAEGKLGDRAHSDELAAFFLDELLRNGTTTALVFGTSHPQSVDSFFTEAQKRQLRMVCGKVMMDRNAPDYLLDTPESARTDCQALIDRWHGVDRLGYAVTPRFAPTSSDQQLQVAGELLANNPGVHLHTHLAENTDECDWVRELFPDQSSYLDVYDHFGLLGRRSVFAHGIHLDNSDWQRLAATHSNLAFCPTSNLFIGSGLFQYQTALKHQVSVGLGTDVGGGDSFSLLRTLNEAYKVQQLQRYNFDVWQMLYTATLGGARALDLHSSIGNFEIGREADFVVLDCNATELIARRTKNSQAIDEKLFALIMLGDDRAIRATYSLGNCVHRRG